MIHSHIQKPPASQISAEHLHVTGSPGSCSAKSKTINRNAHLYTKKDYSLSLFIRTMTNFTVIKSRMAVNTSYVFLVFLCSFEQ